MSYWISAAKTKIKISHIRKRALPSHWFTMTEANSRSEYNNLLEALRNRRKNEARTEIPRFFDALRKEDPNMLPSEIKKKVERDMREFWAQKTIILYTPEQYKQTAKVKAGKMSAEAKKEIILTTNSVAMDGTQLSPDEPKKPDYTTFKIPETQPQSPKRQTFFLDPKTCKGWPCEKVYTYEVEVDENANATRMYSV